MSASVRTYANSFYNVDIQFPRGTTAEERRSRRSRRWRMFRGSTGDVRRLNKINYHRKRPGEESCDIRWKVGGLVGGIPASERSGAWKMLGSLIAAGWLVVVLYESGFHGYERTARTIDSVLPFIHGRGTFTWTGTAVPLCPGIYLRMIPGQSRFFNGALSLFLFFSFLSFFFIFHSITKFHRRERGTAFSMASSIFPLFALGARGGIPRNKRGPRRYYPLSRDFAGLIARLLATADSSPRYPSAAICTRDGVIDRGDRFAWIHLPPRSIRDVPISD